MENDIYRGLQTPIWRPYSFICSLILSINIIDHLGLGANVENMAKILRENDVQIRNSVRLPVARWLVIAPPLKRKEWEGEYGAHWVLDSWYIKEDVPIWRL